MITATYQKYILNFKRPGGTSRGILKTKETYFLLLSDGKNQGIGECGVFRGLSADDRPDYEEKLAWVCKHIHLGFSELLQELIAFPSIQFGLEQAMKSLHGSTPFLLHPSNFTKGEDSIAINGLIWMGSEAFMQEQIKEKLKTGFTTIKMKIGAIDFDTEYRLLAAIRKEFDASEVVLRVDANGAFSPEEALSKLEQLSKLDIHSIEQPIRQGQFEVMRKLCEETPLPIALDEELIGVFSKKDKEELIENIQPQYIILKPSLVGGYQGSQEWIDIAEKNDIGWWVTSALESNIGLNAIAQWTYTFNTSIPQGLGTGSLFSNNFPSPLEVKKGALHYNTHTNWNFNL